MRLLKNFFLLTTFFGFITHFFVLISLILKMESRHCHYHIVSENVLPQIRPFMVAFMSYFLQQSIDRKRNLRIKSVKGLFWRFAKFLGYIEEQVRFDQFIHGLDIFQDYVIKDFVTKENGNIMTSMEQFELFAILVNRKEYDADIYLYQQGNKAHISKTNEHENSNHVIPVIRLLDGRFAATSIYNPFSFDLKNRQLRTETQKARKEKRIAKCKSYFSKFHAV